MMQSRKRGRREGTAIRWTTLCPDVRGHILSKLSYREHARVAQVCREFLEGLLNRVAKERASRILLAEEMIGKAVFRGFVIAVQRVMCGLPAYPGGPLHLKAGKKLIIRAGGPELVAKGADIRAFVRNPSRSGYLWRQDSSETLRGVVCGSCDRALIAMCFSRTQTPDDGLQMPVIFSREAAGAAPGLLLAMCTGNSGATAAHWRNPLRDMLLEEDLQMGQLFGEAGRRQAGAANEPAASFLSVMLRVYYGSGLDLEGKSARAARAKCRDASRAVAKAGNHGLGSEWHGEGLGLCTRLLDNFSAVGAGAALPRDGLAGVSSTL